MRITAGRLRAFLVEAVEAVTPSAPSVDVIVPGLRVKHRDTGLKYSVIATDDDEGVTLMAPDAAGMLTLGWEEFTNAYGPA